MFVVLAVVLGIIIGLIRGGTFRSLFRTKLKLWPLGLIGVFIQIGLHFTYLFGFSSSFFRIISFISYVLILVTLVFNLKNVWTVLTTIGTTFNFIASFLNGGKMAVAGSALKGVSQALSASITAGNNGVYVLMDSAFTKLWFLCDCIPIPKVGVITSFYGTVPAFSIGSFLVFIGIVGWIQKRMIGQKKVQKVTFLDDDNEEGTMDNDFFFDAQDSEFEKIFLQSRENDDLFTDVYDSDFDEKDDDQSDASEKDLTEVIPRLTPELINKISHVSGENQDAELDVLKAETKVFTTISDLDALGSGAKEEENSEDISDSSTSNEDLLKDFEKISVAQALEAQIKERESVPSWLNPKAAKSEVSKAVDGLDNSGDMPVRQEIGRVVDFEEEEKAVKSGEWDPAAVERSIYSSERSERLGVKSQNSNPYSTLFNKGDAGQSASKGRSMDEMRDIWHRFSVSDQKYKHSLYDDDDDLDDRFDDELYAQEDVVQVESTQKETDISVSNRFEQAREAIANDWDKNNPLADIPVVDRTITARVDSTVALRRSLSEKKEIEQKEMLKTYERSRAGFEKVDMQIDGKPISFWRRKKE